MSDLFQTTESGAHISTCGLYRWKLWRGWRRNWRDSAVVWVLLNPSTADAYEDDHTIRRCISFSKAWGAGGMIVVNLFAFRATDPKDLIRAADPVGSRNDEYLFDAAGDGWNRQPLVVAAWGAHDFAQSRAATVYRRLTTDWWCLGTTKNGHPRHPSRVGNAQTFVPFEMEGVG